METEALNLDKLTDRQIFNLVEDGYLARQWGALPGMNNREYWALTANGEQLFHLV
jgi:DNA-binding PadR family transcriptional regulator